MKKSLFIIRLYEVINEIFFTDSSVKIFFHEKKNLISIYKDLQLSQEIIIAYFLPSDLKLLKSKHEKIISIFGNEIFKLKINALEYLQDDNTIKKNSKIINAMNPVSKTVNLVLLETIYQLSQRNFPNQWKDLRIQYLIDTANNFGFWKLRYILEDLFFELKSFEEYEILKSLYKDKIMLNKDIIHDIISILIYNFKKHQLKNVEILSRKKNIYGIYKKMKLTNKNINQINDIFGFRIFTNIREDCYKVYDILKELWNPISKSFTDYIKYPKKNYYQSLHSTHCCLNRMKVEFQIRTYDMDYIAKYGPANHAIYKKSQAIKLFE